MTIGREVGAIPGPVTSPHSAGCHRLLREGGILIRSAGDVLELAGYSADGVPHLWQGSGEASPACAGESHPERSHGGKGDSHHPLALRVREGLSLARTRSVSTVAREAGVSVREAMRGLSMLESDGLAVNIRGQWKLARRPAPAMQASSSVGA